MIVKNASLSIPAGSAGQGLTVAGTVVQFASFGANPTHVFVTVQTASVWVTFDGTDPVAGSNGHQYAPGDSLHLSKAMASASRWIRDSTTSAFLYATPLA